MIYIFQICWISKFRNKTRIRLHCNSRKFTVRGVFYLPLGGGGVSSSEPEELPNDEIL